VTSQDHDPGELNPGELNPGELNPGELNPSELNPGELNPGELSPGERAELEQLRAEVARLRTAATAPAATSASLDAGGPRARGRGRRWLRTTASVLLIMFSCLLAPFSVVAVWARSEVADTNRYVDTVAPLASDPAVQQAIATDITNTVFTYIDVRGLTQQAVTALRDKGALPPEVATSLQGLAVPLANGVQSYTHDQVLKVVQTDAFAQAWTEANRAAHEQLVAVLSGQKAKGVVIEGNAVKLDLAAFLDVVKQRLVAGGFELATKIPPVHTSFVLFESKDVRKVQRGYHLLDTVGLWLPFILVALAGSGIYLARNRRLAFIGTGLGLAAAMLGTGIALTLVRGAYLDSVPSSALSPDAAAALYDALVRFLRDAIRSAGLVGLIAAVGAFLSGPSVLAVTVRRWLVAGFALARGGLADLGVELTGATRWFAARAPLLRGLVAGAAFLVVLLYRYRTPALVGWLTLAVLIGFAVIQFFATEPRRRSPAPPVLEAAPVAAAG
jgi:hypothetical protein